jgi:hypothetical protein
MLSLIFPVPLTISHSLIFIKIDSHNKQKNTPSYFIKEAKLTTFREMED